MDANTAEVPHLWTLGQLARGGSWRLTLPHASTSDLFIWTTRGQGIAHLNGRRRGLGVHNALLIPAGAMFSIDPGKQGFGLAMTAPAGSVRGFPREPVLLRVRDVHMQGEATALLEALQREQATPRPLAGEAAAAHAALLSVWFRRTRDAVQPDAPDASAAERLAAAFTVLAERHFRTGRPMADYAEMLDVTPTHLTRVCRHCAGITAAGILGGRVLHAARSALVDTAQPVSGIARDLGFSSAAYFTRFIQHHTRLSPTALRKAATAGK
ncbi:helix-turn-helix domain-containing protein [Pseudooceanicola sp. LIPI14-2-Ac024]|uniref:AraC family transcriptional regulator n=1 Tax=Pseudooceanicola sp. LIPI14-2-Ac024 TaxID=3344875 RepID=UPI0035D0CC45